MIYEVLVADDNKIIREGLKKILADTDDLVVMGEVDNGRAVIDKVRERNWDLIVLDIAISMFGGPELVKLIKAERPSAQILIFSMYSEEQFALRAISAGASGYLSKESDSELLLPAMRQVAAGGMFISPKVAELLATDLVHRRA